MSVTMRFLVILIVLIILILLVGFLMRSGDILGSIGNAFVVVYKFITSSSLVVGFVTLLVVIAIGTSIH